MANSVHALTLHFNELVAEAERRGVPLPANMRCHTSDFSSRSLAERRIAQVVKIMEGVK